MYVRDRCTILFVFNGSIQFFRDSRQTLEESGHAVESCSLTSMVLSLSKSNVECRMQGESGRGGPKLKALEKIMLVGEYDESLDGDGVDFYLVALQKAA